MPAQVKMDKEARIMMVKHGVLVRNEKTGKRKAKKRSEIAGMIGGTVFLACIVLLMAVAVLAYCDVGISNATFAWISALGMLGFVSGNFVCALLEGADDE